MVGHDHVIQVVTLGYSSKHTGIRQTSEVALFHDVDDAQYVLDAHMRTNFYGDQPWGKMEEQSVFMSVSAYDERMGERKAIDEAMEDERVERRRIRQQQQGSQEVADGR